MLLFLILFLLFSGKENFASSIQTNQYLNLLDTNIGGHKYIPAKTVSLKKYYSLRQNNSPTARDTINNSLLETACPSNTYNYIIDQGADYTITGISDNIGNYSGIKYKCMQSVKDASTDGKISHVRNLVDPLKKTVRTPLNPPTLDCPAGARPVNYSAYSVLTDPTSQYNHTTMIGSNDYFDRDDFISCP